MKLIYHINPNTEFNKIDKKIINENELFTTKEIENINFKNLYNDEFILQMQEPQYEN